MDIGFDRESWANDPADRADGKTGSPEWHGLRARLSAARAARRVLVEEANVSGQPQAGSFDDSSARVLADYGQSQAIVNPVPWSDGKPPRTKDGALASGSHPGERG